MGGREWRERGVRREAGLEWVWGHARVVGRRDSEWLSAGEWVSWRVVAGVSLPHPLCHPETPRLALHARLFLSLLLLTQGRQ